MTKKITLTINADERFLLLQALDLSFHSIVKGGTTLDKDDMVKVLSSIYELSEKLSDTYKKSFEEIIRNKKK